MLFISILNNLYFKEVLYIHPLSLYSCFQLTKTHGALSPVAQLVKNLPANAGDAEMRVKSLGQEDCLEKEMATRSSILAWRIPWTKETGGLQSMGSQRVRHH